MLVCYCEIGVGKKKFESVDQKITAVSAFFLCVSVNFVVFVLLRADLLEKIIKLRLKSELAELKVMRKTPQTPK